MYEPLLAKLVGDDFTVTGDEARLVCPVHEMRTGRPDSNPSFYMNVATGLCICFSCGYRGSIRTLWSLLRGEELTGDEDLGEGSVRVLRGRLSKMLAPAPSDSPLDPAELLMLDHPDDGMLASRGISRESAMSLGIRASGGAWVLPIFDFSGTLMGLQKKDGPWVRNHPSGVRKSRSLFGLGCVGDGPVLVVESPLDVAVCMTHGLQAVATYGTSVSEEQVRVMDGFPSVILAMDADRAGSESSKKLLARLSTEVREVTWPPGMKDPGDAGPRIVDVAASAVLPLAARVKRLLRA